ncbi:rhodanese domain-containing protein [Coprinopsis sp. MPI-PUGE-AT-0042]|nr:rhodanese domain-containing protein [Coprinopsis sp. MPI-PUGE-AT-0042]
MLALPTGRSPKESQVSRSTSSSRTTVPATFASDQPLVPHRGTGTVTSSNGFNDSETGAPFRTLDDLEESVAQEVAVRCISKGQSIDGVRIGVHLSLETKDDKVFLRRIASNLAQSLRLSSYLFLFGSDVTSIQDPKPPSSLIAIASSPDLVQRAMLLISAKFIGRVSSSVMETDLVWGGQIKDLGGTSYDETALWDVVRKSARQPIDPLRPPPGSIGIDEMLSNARARLQRITPEDAWRELQDNGSEVAPTFLVDIRPEAQRRKFGGIRGALVIERNVLEWRLDPRSDAKLSIADRYDLRIIVFCMEGYTSSLAAYSLQQLGLLNATDIIGGIEAWKLAGLPIDREQDEARTRSLVSLAGSVV